MIIAGTAAGVVAAGPGSGAAGAETSRGDRISEVGRACDLRGADIVGLRGKYVLPGLADMHMHSFMEPIDPPLYLANGVTTVREMSGNETVRAPRWRPLPPSAGAPVSGSRGTAGLRLRQRGR